MPKPWIVEDKYMESQWRSSAEFFIGLGVDTHIPYTDGSYAYVNTIVSDLNYLGLTQVRDGITNGQNGSASLSSYIQLAQTGVQFTFGILASNDADIAAQINLIQQVEAAVSGSVVAVEGPNEINNYPVTFDGVSGLQGALNEQKAIYQAVHTNPVLTDVAVDYFTGYGAGGIADGPDPSVTPGLADFDTQHPYPRFGQAPALWVARSTALPNEPTASGPGVYTETGYSTLDVSQDVQAKYELDLLMDTASQGITKTYLYELMDAYSPGSPQGDDGWGLFDYTNAPKSVATAIHNLTTVLHSTTISAPIGQINYTISGLPSTGNSLGLAKPDGSDIIVVWNEPQIWNSATSTEITAPLVPITIDLGGVYSLIQVVDPLNVATPIMTYTNTEFAAVTLTDHPLLIQVSDTATQVVSTPPPSASSSTSSGATPTTINSLVLDISEDTWQGDAQYTISVDGQKIGGLMTASASHAAGQTQAIAVDTTLAAGQHTVTVDFLNDAYGGTPSTDRNLYVDGATLNGQIIVGSTMTMFSQGTQSFNVTVPGTPTPAATAPTNPTSGLVLDISEDAWQGDAQYTISVDGQKIGGLMTASASHAAGQTQAIAVDTTLAAGQHTVTVDFLNDAYGGTPSTDRNLYVDGATLNGQIIVGSTMTMFSQGTQSFNVTVPGTPTPAATAPTNPTSGLVLDISEDAWQGDAQYTISVDGQKIGGLMTASASHAAGQTQAIAVDTTLAAGQHTVTVDFLNDAYGGTPSTDRNLYVDGATLNGQIIVGSTMTMFSQGTQSFNVTVPGTPTPAATTTTNPTSGLVLDISEDAWQGDAQYTISVDGQKIGGLMTASASHAAGQTQAVSFNPLLAAGNHTVAISFLNDAYGGTPTTDRNLYLDSATLNGAVIPGSAITMLSQGTSTFNMLIPST